MSSTGEPRRPSPFGPYADQLRAERAARQAAAEAAKPVRREQVTKRELVERLFELRPLLDDVLRQQRDRSTPAFKAARDAFMAKASTLFPRGTRYSPDLIDFCIDEIRSGRSRSMRAAAASFKRMEDERAQRDRREEMERQRTAEQRRMARNQAYANVVDPNASPFQQMAGYMMVDHFFD